MESRGVEGEGGSWGRTDRTHVPMITEDYIKSKRRAACGSGLERGGLGGGREHSKTLDLDADDTLRAPTLAGFGGVALFTVIFYASGIPRLQDDVLKACYPFRFCPEH
jgi:hypothetical protein